MKISPIWRMTLATIVLAVAFTAALVTLLERAHREAVITDYELSSTTRVRAGLSTPLDAFDGGRLTDDERRAFERASNEARKIDAVSGVRVYEADGTPVYPADAPAAKDDVALALAADRPIPVEAGPQVQVYAPYRSRRAMAYVIAVDFTTVRLRSSVRDRAPVFTLAGLVAAIVTISLIVLAFGTSHELERRRRDAQTSFLGALDFMADAIDMRDSYTAGHSRRVAAYSRALATALGLPPAEIDTIENSALLHDIGKIGVPDEVLFKPGPLDPQERRTIETHPALGARLLTGIASMEAIVPCVLHHHERLDGTGYPQGLAGDRIPRGARVIAVADTFDAMTSDRPYRRALPAAEALREMERVAWTQLDPAIVRTFVDAYGRGDIVLLAHSAYRPVEER